MNTNHTTQQVKITTLPPPNPNEKPKVGRPRKWPIPSLEIYDAFTGSFSAVTVASQYKRKNPGWNYVAKPIKNSNPRQYTIQRIS